MEDSDSWHMVGCFILVLVFVCPAAMRRYTARYTVCRVAVGGILETCFSEVCTSHVACYLMVSWSCLHHTCFRLLRTSPECKTRADFASDTSFASQGMAAHAGKIDHITFVRGTRAWGGFFVRVPVSGSVLTKVSLLPRRDMSADPAIKSCCV